MIYLYTFHKNELRIFEGCYFKEDSVFHPHEDIDLIYIHKKDGSRRIVSKNEGVVYADQLWLTERDDQKAIGCLIGSRQDKTIKLEIEIEKLSEQIKRLYLLRGVKHEISD